MVDGLETMLREAEGHIDDADASSSSPARPSPAPRIELARTIVRRAERRAVSLQARRRLIAGPQAAPVPEPPRGPAVGPRPGGRAGRGAIGAALPARPAARRAARPPASTAATVPPPPRGATDDRTTRRARPPSSSASGRRRPSPSGLLTHAFGWMFVGTLLTAAVAFAVQSSPTLTAFAGRAYIFLFIGQIAIAVDDRRGDPSAQRDRRARAVLRVRRVVRPDRRADRPVLHGRLGDDRVRRRVGDVRRRGDLRRDDARRWRASGASC